MKKLERSLGLKQVLVVGFSAMLGTGIFVTPGIIYSATGPSLFIAYILGAILVLPAAMSMSELATAMPTSGGIYVYTDRTFGPFLGTIVGFGLWLSLLFKSAFALKGFGEYLQVFTDFPAIWTTLAMLVLVTFLNIGGVGKVAGSLAIVVLACLLCVAGVGAFSIPLLTTENATPLFTGGAEGFMVALSLGVGAYAGLTKLTAIAEEVQRPEINLSKGILFSLIGVSLVYLGTSFIFALALGSDTSSNNLKPLHTLATITTGNLGGGILAIIAILTLVSMANAGILAASRFPFAMSRDKLLPSLFGKIHPKFLTPLSSILLSSLVIAIIIIGLDVAKVAKLASVFIIQMFILVNVTVIALRESGTRWYTPKYKSPFYPYQHVFGILSGLTLLFYMGSLTVLSLIMVGIPSILIYFFYGKKTQRKGVIGIHGPRADLVSESKPFTFTCMESLELTKDAKVIVPLFGGETSPEVLAEVGNSLANGEAVEVVHITEVPEQTELNDLDDPPGLRALRRRISVMAGDKNAAITFDSVATHDLAKTLFDIGERLHSKWILTEWSGKRRGRMTFNNPMRWIKDHLNCHLVWFSDKGVRNFRKILVLVKGSDSDKLVLETAGIIANANNATITIAHDKSVELDSSKQSERREVFENLVVNSKTRVATTEITLDEKAQSVIDLSVEYDLVILGSDTQTAFKTFFESRDDRILLKAACSVFCISPSK